jgi:hypothetical protein
MLGGSTETGNPVFEFKNNIIYHTRTGNTLSARFYDDYDTNLDADYNLWYDSTGYDRIRRNGTTYTYAGYQTAGFEANSVVSDNPDMTDAAGADFTLTAASPTLRHFGSSPFC